ncbi:hypothetical protein L1D32_01295 [Shewanella insulae]|uniref:hypothetical protein n=1 Tax=Shewanella insulae TaxID=2681496 RepID=UPI001EFEB08F|nr:hypothetical protein [Shewanella insulae]MCG9736795.1 hypothetical protein [Shewanella insulae]
MSTSDKNSSSKSFVVPTNDSFQGIANCSNVEKRSLSGAGAMQPKQALAPQSTSTGGNGASAMKPQSPESK